MAQIIEANYEALDQVVARFMQQSESAEQMLQSVRSHMESLQGEWIGEGSDAFFAEMSDEVLPACDRLVQALQAASEVTRQTATVMLNAEEEASGAFQVAI